MVRLTVDADTCIGCGLCVGSYSTAFAFNDEGKAIVIDDIDEASADEVVATCPVGAISK